MTLVAFLVLAVILLGVATRRLELEVALVAVLVLLLLWFALVGRTGG